jgi:nucleoside-triphosphatase THEP1
MVAIAAEGFLVEAGTALLGGNAAGFLLGGGLAMSWALAHKIANMLIFYGPDAVAVYSRGLEKLRAAAGLGQGNIYGPLLLLLGVYFLVGAAAAVLGMRAGTGDTAASGAGMDAEKAVRRQAPRRAFSITALAAHIIFLVAVLAAGRSLTVWKLAAFAVVYGALCAWFYPRASALLRRPGVWGGVLAVSFLAGLVLGAPLAGLYMALRAFVLTMGFSAVGEELLNPRIRAALERFVGGAFFETLEYAFAALPGIMEAFPSGRDLARRPVGALRSVIAMAPGWLEAISGRRVYVITGVHGGGKSELVAELAELLRAAGKKTGGICAAGLWANGVRSGFDLVDLSSGKRVPLSRRGLHDAAVKAGEFGFYKEGLAAGEEALSAEALSAADVVFIDEIGFLELEGGGWAPALERLLNEPGRALVIVCRDYLLEKVCARWQLDSAAVWTAGKTTADTACAELLKGAAKLIVE